MQLVGNAEDCLVFLQEILLFTLIKTVSEYFHKLFPVFFEYGVKVTRLGITLHLGSRAQAHF